MIRKLLGSNAFCLAVTGILWIATIIVRFVLAGLQIESWDWLVWIACNNLMVAGFAYQLGVITFKGPVKRSRLLSRIRTVAKVKAGKPH